jgi:hypothetical protein
VGAIDHPFQIPVVRHQYLINVVFIHQIHGLGQIIGRAYLRQGLTGHNLPGGCATPFFLGDLLDVGETYNTNKRLFEKSILRYLG